MSANFSSITPSTTLRNFMRDGFRYDEISGLLSMNCDSGWAFCRSLTDTLRYVKPRLIAKCRSSGRGEVRKLSESLASIVTPTPTAAQASSRPARWIARRSSRRDTGSILGGKPRRRHASHCRQPYPQGSLTAGDPYPVVENHDIVKAGAEPRLPALADSARPSFMVRAQPFAVRHGNIADRSRNSAGFHGTGNS